MKPVAGWYVDPDNARHERYWNGSRWNGAARPLREDRPPFTESDVTVTAERSVTHEEYVEELLEQILGAERRSAGYLAVLAWVTIIFVVLAVLGGILGGLAAGGAFSGS